MNCKGRAHLERGGETTQKLLKKGILTNLMPEHIMLFVLSLSFSAFIVFIFPQEWGLKSPGLSCCKQTPFQTGLLTVIAAHLSLCIAYVPFWGFFSFPLVTLLRSQCWSCQITVLFTCFCREDLSKSQVGAHSE